MYYGRKKGIIIAIVIVAVVLTLGIAGTCVYMFTDLFKSNQNLFWKYMGQTLGNIKIQENTQIEEILKLQEQNPYLIEGELTANYDGNEETVNNVLENAKATVNSQIDKVNDYVYSNIKIDYSNNQLFELKYIQDEDTYALKSDEIVTAYIGIKNENLKVLAQKLLGDKIDTSIIPNSIEYISIANLLELSEEEQSNIVNTYSNILKDNIDKSNYSKQTQAVIENNGVQYETTSYRVDLTATEISELLVKILTTLKEDNMTLNMISRKMQEIGTDEDETSIINITEQIDDLIDEIIDTTFTDTAFVVYAYKGQVIATEIILRNTAKVTIYAKKENNQYKTTIKIENLSDKEDYRVITVDINEQNTTTSSTATINIDVDGNNACFSIQNIGSATQRSLNTQIESSFTIDDETITLNYFQTMEFVNSLENVEGLDNTNCAILNDYSTDDLNTLMQALVQQIIVVFSNKVQMLGLI